MIHLSLTRLLCQGPERKRAIANTNKERCGARYNKRSSGATYNCTLDLKTFGISPAPVYRGSTYSGEAFKNILPRKCSYPRGTVAYAEARRREKQYLIKASTAALITVETTPIRISMVSLRPSVLPSSSEADEGGRTYGRVREMNTISAKKSIEQDTEIRQRQHTCVLHDVT